MNAYEWGVAHGSCIGALKLRKNFKSQEDWWKGCNRSDWMLWQLRHGLTEVQLQKVMPQLLKATDKTVERARASATAIAMEAERWTRRAAECTAAAAKMKCARWATMAVVEAVTAARAALWTAGYEEKEKQAKDILSEIPEWIWG